MKVNEFAEWFAHHCSRFTAVRGWLTKFPQDEREPGEPTRKSIYAAWQAALAHASYHDAKTASDAMFCGEEEPPRSYDDHPKRIRQIIHRRNPTTSSPMRNPQRLINGEETFRCSTCHDEGFVLVYRDDSIEAMRDGKARHPELAPEGRTYVREVAIGCACRCDPRMSRSVVYSPDRHIRCTETTTDGQFRELQAACDAGVAGTAFNADAWEQAK